MEPSGIPKADSVDSPRRSSPCLKSRSFASLRMTKFVERSANVLAEVLAQVEAPRAISLAPQGENAGLRDDCAVEQYKIGTSRRRRRGEPTGIPKAGPRSTRLAGARLRSGQAFASLGMTKFVERDAIVQAGAKYLLLDAQGLHGFETGGPTRRNQSGQRGGDRQHEQRNHDA